MQTPQQNTPPTDHRIEALELFLQHLVLVLECEPRFTAARMRHWLGLATERMHANGSATPGTLAALARLQREALE